MGWQITVIIMSVQYNNCHYISSIYINNRFKDTIVERSLRLMETAKTTKEVFKWKLDQINDLYHFKF